MPQTTYICIYVLETHTANKYIKTRVPCSPQRCRAVVLFVEYKLVVVVVACNIYKFKTTLALSFVKYSDLNYLFASCSRHEEELFRNSQNTGFIVGIKCRWRPFTIFYATFFSSHILLWVRTTVCEWTWMNILSKSYSLDTAQTYSHTNANTNTYWEDRSFFCQFAHLVGGC